MVVTLVTRSRMHEISNYLVFYHLENCLLLILFLSHYYHSNVFNLDNMVLVYYLRFSPSFIVYAIPHNIKNCDNTAYLHVSSKCSVYLLTSYDCLEYLTVDNTSSWSQVNYIVLFNLQAPSCPRTMTMMMNTLYTGNCWIPFMKVS